MFQTKDFGKHNRSHVLHSTLLGRVPEILSTVVGCVTLFPFTIPYDNEKMMRAKGFLGFSGSGRENGKDGSPHRVSSRRRGARTPIRFRLADPFYYQLVY